MTIKKLHVSKGDKKKKLSKKDQSLLKHCLKESLQLDVYIVKNSLNGHLINVNQQRLLKQSPKPKKKSIPKQNLNVNQTKIIAMPTVLTTALIATKINTSIRLL